jgi:hypothetical protein
LKEVVPGLSRVAILFNPTNRYMPLALPARTVGIILPPKLLARADEVVIE